MGNGKPRERRPKLDLAEVVMQLDWRVSGLASELQLTESQIARVRIVLAHAMADCIGGLGRISNSASALERIGTFLSADQLRVLADMAPDRSALLFPGGVECDQAA